LTFSQAINYPQSTIHTFVPLQLLPLLIALAVLCLALWFTADIRHLRRWHRKKAELAANGAREELTAHFEKGLHSLRPLARLFCAFKVPGNIETMYAVHLHRLGDNEKALNMINRALAAARGQDKHRLNKLRIQALICSALGRYADAQTALQQARPLDTESAECDVIEGTLKLRQGQIDEAIALAQRAVNSPKRKDAARILLADGLFWLGKLKEAMDVLRYEPSNVLTFFTPANLALVTRDQMGKDMVLNMDRAAAAIFRPAPLLRMAALCFEAGDKANMKLLLDRAETELKSDFTIRSLYLRTRAACCALHGDASAAQATLTELRASTAQTASRATKLETCYAGGRVNLILGNTPAAIEDFQSALQLVLHPLERHRATYWLGRGHQAAGNLKAAQQSYQDVIAQNFRTWIVTDAAIRLEALSKPTQP
jgi:tetratricopeptide (TPR) repeat protein